MKYRLQLTISLCFCHTLVPDDSASSIESRQPSARQRYTSFTTNCTFDSEATVGMSFVPNIILSGKVRTLWVLIGKPTGP